MERERWSEIVAGIRALDREFDDIPGVEHRTATIVMVHTWAAFRDRSVSWACRRANWLGWKRPPGLPDQSTMSRRVRTPAFAQFQERLGQKLNQVFCRDCLGQPDRPPAMLRIADGKALEVPAHSTDRDAAWGRGVGGVARGYKLHAIWADLPMPEAWTLTPLSVCEKRMCRRLLKRLPEPAGGYLLTDALFDKSQLHDECVYYGHQMLCPRIKPGTGLGHGYQSPHRLRSMAMLEPPIHASGFGLSLYAQRTRIERCFGNAVSFGGGLGALPAWVRRPWRVRAWVTAKLLINAARIIVNHRAAAA
jgi:hypothetical protein